MPVLFAGDNNLSSVVISDRVSLKKMMTTHDTERIDIVMYGDGLKNSPTLINTGNVLAKEGVAVECFTFHRLARILILAIIIYLSPCCAMLLL